MTNDLLLKLPSHWDLLEEIRVALRKRLANLHPELLQATVMTASELTENAIKYGQRTDACHEATFRFALTSAHITIEVRNGLANAAQFDHVRHQVQEIDRATDLLELYATRLRELLERNVSSGSAGLGLCRIAAEGKFSLACTCDHNVLTMTATRATGGV